MYNYNVLPRCSLPTWQTEVINFGDAELLCVCRGGGGIIKTDLQVEVDQG